MTAPSDDPLGYAADDDVPLPYMARTRDYYRAIGYETPYRWAHYNSAPFQPLRKLLAQSRVTSASPSRSMRRRFLPAAVQMKSTPSCSSRTARCATRP